MEMIKRKLKGTIKENIIPLECVYNKEYTLVWDSQIGDYYFSTKNYGFPASNFNWDKALPKNLR